MDNQNGMAELVLHIVKGSNGIKLSILIKQINNDLRLPLPPFQITNIVNELVGQKKLMEIEYTNDMFTVDSFLVPAKTKLNVRGEVPEPPRRI